MTLEQELKVCWKGFLLLITIVLSPILVLFYLFGLFKMTMDGESVEIGTKNKKE